MQNIKLKNVSKSYPSKSLFENVSFSLSVKDRIGIIGENGTGKSTLLKIVSGQEAVDNGTIEGEKYSIAYIAQEFDGDEALTISEYLHSVSATPKTWELVKQLGWSEEIDACNTLMKNLSGGQKRIIEIASVLSQQPKYLCIDEPENHLDIYARSILVDKLNHYSGGVIFVSHDRFLINEVANKIIEIRDQTTDLHSGMSYEEFQLRQKIDTERKISRWKSERRALDKLGKSVALLQRRAQVNSDTARTYQAKKRELENRIVLLGAKPTNESKEARLRLQNEKLRNGKMLFNTDAVSLSYEKEKVLLKEVSVKAHYGDRIVLLGRNGSGKSSFLRLLKREMYPDTGAVRVGENLNIVFFNQQSDIDGDKSPLDLLEETGMSEEQARSKLAQILFSKSESDSCVRNLSGGQKQRLRFLLLFSAKPEFVVLDEPTNNLDPTTWDLLLRLLNEFTGSFLIVSHDREFIDQLENIILWILSKQTIKRSWKKLSEAIIEL